ncbi:MAG: dihydroorotase, partial [Methanobacteriota archaeon]
MPDLVIKNAKIFIDNAIQPAEIAIDNGKITKVGKIIDAKDVDGMINAKYALVLPGAIDVHVHFRDPG